MRMKDKFPSRFLKSADLDGKSVRFKIINVCDEEVGFGSEKETKPILYFAGTKKGLILNKTNNDLLVQSLGDESDAWIGKVIGLKVVETAWGPGIRVDVSASSKPKPAAPDIDEINSQLQTEAAER